ncbi:hypothetical protein FHP25_24825 [Vineibacter terrae]|uniref:Uncharacterized protein n=1 Tax=Vineibacter terrae TaxID=2586908 RepID=A0A5C8PG72_9HYPH|nr:hypothetical protein [Vineibacter terrae]TXL72522.1 hypothetical protein FHP25_24825 [Vineibacter terrae]
MGAHLIEGEFQSDKYPTTPRGKVPLSVKDQMAQDLLWQYAQRRRAVDAEFSDDLETALLNAGSSSPPVAEVLVYPPMLTPALSQVLGLMIMQTAPLAHGFRDAGHPIASRVEDEQAFVLDWLVRKAIRHGDDWRRFAGEDLARIAAQLRATKAPEG